MGECNIENLKNGDIINFFLINNLSVRKIFIQGIVSKIENFAELSNIFIKDVSPQIVFQYHYDQHCWIVLDIMSNQYYNLDLLTNQINFPDFMPVIGEKVTFEIFSAKNKTEVISGREFQVGVRYIAYEGNKVVQSGLGLPVFEHDLLYWEPKFLSKKGEWIYLDKDGVVHKVNLIRNV